MKLAFWKRKRSRNAAPKRAEEGIEAGVDSGSGDGDDEGAAAKQLLRVRARRRLIGAFALLLAVVVIVPMLLDPAPRVVPDDIPIELPSDRTPFAPRLVPPAAEAAPPVTEAGAPPAAPGSAADAAAVAGDAPAPADAAAHGANARHADDAEHAAKKDETAHPAGRIFVQAAALTSESAARELVARLGKAGLTAFVEHANTGEGVRYRVRLGPFATRSAAERARARLRALGVGANIVGA